MMDIPSWVWGVAAEGGALSCRAVVKGKAAAKLEESFFRGSRALLPLMGGCFVVTSRPREEALLPWSLSRAEHVGGRKCLLYNTPEVN